MTADGPAAIAVLRLWGLQAVDVADRLFRPRLGSRGLAESEPGELRLGWFGGDEVVALIVPEAVGESTDREVEIQGHGSPLLLDSIVDMLRQDKVVVASRDDYLRAHGVAWIERSALHHLGRATASKAAVLLWSQSQGTLRRELESIVSLVESGRTGDASVRIDALCRTARWATRLSAGFKVALAGPPNVGKSTLVNALAGYERVLVSPIPGTTRDLVNVALTLGGWPIHVTDTAGLRETTDDPLEAAGMELARAEHLRADLVLRLSELGEGLVARPADPSLLDVRTKADLVDGSHGRPDPETAQVVSAKTGEGLEGLIAAVLKRLVPDEIETSSRPPMAVVFDDEIAETLRQAQAAIERDDGPGSIAFLVDMLKRP